MNRRRFVATTTAVLGGISLAGCTGETEYEDGDDGGGGNGGSGNKDNDGSDSDKKLELLDHEFVRENEGEMSEQVKVVGTAKNVSGDQLGYAEVKAKFYDEEGTLIDSFLDNVNDLGDGEKWKFEVLYSGMGDDAAQIADYKVGVGSNF